MRWRIWRTKYPMRTWYFTFEGQHSGRIEYWDTRVNCRSQAEAEAMDYLERRYEEPFDLIECECGA